MPYILETVPATSESILAKAGEVMTGFISLTGDFFAGLWANPMGQIIIVLGLVSAAIGLCVRLFLRRRKVWFERGGGG